VLPRAIEVPISSLSGGNQQKVVFARWLETAPRVLLLDEPTQGVDVAARRGLHDQVRAAADDGLAVVLVSSDARELAELSDRVLAVKDGRIGAELVGDAITPMACVEAAYGVHMSTSGATG
jgi:ABC-type sugar transport system ATPase subunit